MKSLIIGVIAVFCVFQSALARTAELAVLYEPDQPGRGVVFVVPGVGRQLVYLASRLTFANEGSEVVVVTAHNTTLQLVPDGKPPKVIHAETAPRRFLRDQGTPIFVNNYRTTSAEIADLFPEIPGPVAERTLANAEAVRDFDQTPPDMILISPPEPAPENQTFRYSIMEGDTLRSIAQIFVVTEQELLEANPALERGKRLRPGTEIIIPAME